MAPPITISVEDAAYHLSTFQTNKATGPNKIIAYFLKRTAPSIAPILATVFQLSLQQGILTSDWKTANIIPIHKKGSRSQTSNYRPVSLTSICCKIQNISSTHIYHHLQTYNILKEEQHGFPSWQIM